MSKLACPKCKRETKEEIQYNSVVKTHSKLYCFLFKKPKHEIVQQCIHCGNERNDLRLRDFFNNIIL